MNYRTLGVARSSVSVFLKVCSDIDITASAEVTRFMKGVFLQRPVFPKYQTTWDVDLVLKHLATVKHVNLLQLSCKFCMLFLLLTAQRGQNLHLLELDDICLSKDKLVIYPKHLLKQSRPGHHIDNITLQAYTKNKYLCIVHVLKEYLDRTKDLRTGSKLLISTIKPHKAVSRSTISRWVKLIMLKSGVDKAFAPHSVRSAATSKAKLQGIPLETILKTAGWSNAKTFAMYYDKPIVVESNFQKSILQK
jgi:integrase